MNKEKTNTAPPVERVSLTVTEAAKAMGTSPTTVYDLIRSERGFPFVRVGERKLVIPVTPLKAWLAREVEEPTA